MPPYFSQSHDYLIRDLLQRGTSNNISEIFQAFIYNQRGFVEPCNLYLNHFFFYDDDFCLNSSFLKVGHADEYLLFDKSNAVCGVTERLFQEVFRASAKRSLQLHQQQGLPQKLALWIRKPSDLYQNYPIFLFFPDLIKAVHSNIRDVQSSIKNAQRLKNLPGSPFGAFISPLCGQTPEN